jgi:hypothetical protein
MRTTMAYASAIARDLDESKSREYDALSRAEASKKTAVGAMTMAVATAVPAGVYFAGKTWLDAIR